MDFTIKPSLKQLIEAPLIVGLFLLIHYFLSIRYFPILDYKSFLYLPVIVAFVGLLFLFCIFLPFYFAPKLWVTLLKKPSGRKFILLFDDKIRRAKRKKQWFSTVLDVSFFYLAYMFVSVLFLYLIFLLPESILFVTISVPAIAAPFILLVQARKRNKSQKLATFKEVKKWHCFNVLVFTILVSLGSALLLKFAASFIIYFLDKTTSEAQGMMILSVLTLSAVSLLAMEFRWRLAGRYQLISLCLILLLLLVTNVLKNINN